MYSAVRRRLQTSVAQIMAHARTPLYRNGYALILSSVSTSGLGVVYWILAARIYAAEIVGLNSAAISAMMFLAGVSQLNLMSALMRFIPKMGRATRQFVINTYLIATAVAAAASLVYILGLETWSPALGFIRSDLLFVLWFSAATMAWCIFVLQDSALTGLRQATWVPIENSIFAIAKLVLLLALAGPFPQYGVFASWTIALMLSLLPTNFLIFQYLIPRHVQETQDQQAPPAPSQVARYVAGDYVGSLFWLMATTLMPVIVIEIAGAAATAYFYLSWTIINSLYNFSADMGASLIVEGSRDPAKLGIYSQRMVFQTAKIVTPLVVVLLVGAPWILAIFGGDYAAEGAMLLRILALSTIPNIITALYIATARVQRRVTAVVVVLATLCVLVLGLSFVLLKMVGVVGVGWAWLISQSMIASVLLFTQFRRLWVSLPEDRRSPSQSRTTPTQLIYRLAVIVRPLVLVGQPLLNYWSNRTRFAQVAKFMPDILPTIPSIAGAPPIRWTEQRCIRTVNDMVVIAVGPPNRPPAALVKLPQSASARTSLHRHKTVLETLGKDSRLGEWRALLPTVLAAGDVSGQPYLVEQIMPGVDARRIIGEPAARARFQIAAASSIGQLHARTAASVIVNEGLLECWIDEPLRAIRDAQTADQQKAIERLAVELRQALVGRRLVVSWIHGDFVPDNILVTPDGSALLGIVDWELGQPDDLPRLDRLHLLLSTRVLAQRRELGDVLRALLGGEPWTPEEQALLDREPAALTGDSVSPRAMLLLAWLRHVSANLTKSTHYATHWLWLAKNVQAVLQLV